MNKTGFLSLVVVVAVTGCATIPTGPSVMVLPGSVKTFEQFQTDDTVCRQWAQQGLGITPGQAATSSTVTGAAIGTLAGAVLGAAIGAAAGSPGTGAAIGAGGGLLFGTAAGASAGEIAELTVQRRYDIAYQQCMYAKGNQIPGVVAASQPVALPPPPPPPASAPTPPASAPAPSVPPANAPAPPQPEG